MPSPTKTTHSAPPNRRAGTHTRVIAIIAAVVALIVFYDKGVKDNLFPRNFGIVEPGEVYRSGRLTPAALRKIHEEHQIKTIVDLGAYDEGSRKDKIAQSTADALGITRIRLPRLEGDATGDPNSYVEALKLLADQNTRPILIHCAAGSERTSACMILYEEVVLGEDGDTAREAALRHKHDPDDNPKLAAFLAKWQPAIERAFQTGETIEPERETDE